MIAIQLDRSMVEVTAAECFVRNASCGLRRAAARQGRSTRARTWARGLQLWRRLSARIEIRWVNWSHRAEPDRSRVRYRALAAVSALANWANNGSTTRSSVD